MRANRFLRTVGWMLPFLCVGGLALVACGVSWNSVHGHSVSSHDGRLTVDGVKLPYDRWVEVKPELTAATPLALTATTGPIELSGDPAGACVLSVHVHSEVAEDGEVYQTPEGLAVRSTQGKKVFMDGVRGTVPESHALRLDSVSGDVSVRGVAKGSQLEIDTTSGDIVVAGCEPAALLLDSTSGDARVEQSQSRSLTVDTTSGDTALVGGAWGALHVESVSGDLKLTGCTADELSLHSTSGNLVVSGGRLQRATMDTVSGKVNLIDGAQVDQLTQD